MSDKHEEYEQECERYDDQFAELVNEYILERFSSGEAKEMARQKLGPRPSVPEGYFPEPAPKDSNGKDVPF